MTIKNLIETPTEGNYENIQLVLSEYLNDSLALIPQYLLTASGMYEKYNQDATLLVEAIQKYLNIEEYDGLTGACLYQNLCTLESKWSNIDDILDYLKQFLSKNAKTLYEHEISNLNNYFELLASSIPEKRYLINELVDHTKVIPLMDDKHSSKDRINIMDQLLQSGELLVEKLKQIENEEEKSIYNKTVAPYIPSDEEQAIFDRYRKDHDIVANSQAMLGVFKKIEQYKDDITVLITGETGVGKELVANAIHKQSNRRTKDKIYETVNCGAIKSELVVAELFGAKKGSYTGAIQDRKGFFQYCDNGTIFLDEIGELSSDTQAALLRVLENGEIQMLGSTKALKTDVRVIAATNRNLVQEVKEKQFKPDLLSRLDQASIHVPSLKERLTDIPILAKHFFDLAVKKIAKQNNYVSKPLSQLLKVNDFYPLVDMDWPRNARGLKNAIVSFVHRNFNYLHDIKPWMVEQLIKDDGITVQDLLATPTVKEHPELEEKHWSAMKSYIGEGYDQTKARKKVKLKDSRTLLKYVNTVLLVAGNEMGFDINEVAKWLTSKLADNSVDMEQLAVEIKSRYDKISDDYPRYHDMPKKPWEPWVHEIAQKLSNK